MIAVDSANSDDSLRSELKLTKTAPLYQKVSYELLEGGLGGKFQFYFKNASGLASHWWAQVGLMPMKGTEVSSVRYASNLSLAKSLKGYKKAPEDVTELYQWQIGDSITYQSKGGLIFVAGTGFGFPGLTATSLAQGTWEVHVEKVSKSKVYVKITKSKLHALSMSAGSGLAAVGLHQFKNADDGFSYLLDLQNEEARKVYMDLVRGNVTAAQNLSSPQSQSPSAIPAVQKVENFKRFSKGKGISFFFGLPIFLNVTKSENKIQSLSVTDFLIDQSKVKAQFGIYDLTVQTKALGIHTVISKAFYGVKYLISDLKTSVAKEKGEFGRFSWVYQDDRGSTRTLKNSLVALIDQTGFDQLNLAIPQTSAGLDFTNLSLNLKMNSDNTRLVSDRFARMSKSDLKDWATKRAEHAYSLKGDSLCTLSSESQTSCEQLLVSETVYGAKKMQETLEEMKKKAGNDASYTKAFAEFGKLAMTNQVTLGMMISLAGRGLEMNFAVEGTYFQPVKISYITNDSGGFERIKSAKDADTSLDPKYKRSKFHGVITNKNLSGLGSPL